MISIVIRIPQQHCVSPREMLLRDFPETLRDISEGLRLSQSIPKGFSEAHIGLKGSLRVIPKAHIGLKGSLRVP